MLKEEQHMVPELAGKTYMERLQELNLTTLDYRRRRYDLIQTYKLIKGDDDVLLQTVFQLSDTELRRHSFKLAKLRAMEGENNEGASVNIEEMLELQLSEVEMLKSMFPMASEFKLDDETAVINISGYLKGLVKYEYLHSRIGFTIVVNPEPGKLKIELVCQFPHEYPSVPPVIFTRSSDMSRSNHRKLNEDLQEYVLSLDRGELCIYSVSEWIQENLSNYESEETSDNTTETSKHKVEEDTILTQLWIYSHHIYSKFKRKDIIDWAHELKLTGFSLPGKPGVICVEGYSRPVDEYWHRLRRLNWKKLVVKEKYEKDIGDDDLSKHRKFVNFEEKVFDVRGGKGREYHMDLGMLYEYLVEHGCGQVFQMYFGVEGKATTS